MLVAIYARHSTDKQVTSANDQVDRCNKFCADHGYSVAQVFTDEEISGSHMINRPAIIELMKDATAGRFDGIVTEDISRLSRDQGDISVFYKRMIFLGVFIHSVYEGMINELHIGFKGTMNALYLNDLADKTRRGILAVASKGRVPTGKIIGYDLVRHIDATGNQVRGLRKINEEEADLVRRLFSEYASGMTLKAVCEQLNDEGIPSPRGKLWQKTVLCGTFSRQAGILRNTLYKGVLTYNKQTYRKNPDTGKKVPSVNPPEKWLHVPIPKLAIMEAPFFDEVQRMLESRSTSFINTRHEFTFLSKEEKREKKNEKERERKARIFKISRKIFSGKMWCSRHGRKLNVLGKELYGCPVAHCPNRHLKKEDLLEQILKMAVRSEDDVLAVYEDPKVARTRVVEEKAVAKLEKRQSALRRCVSNILETLGHTGHMETTRDFLAKKEREISRLQIDITRHTEKRDYHTLPSMLERRLKRYHAHLDKLRRGPDNARLNRLLRDAFTRIDVEPVWNDSDEAFEHTCTVEIDILKLMAVLDS